MTHGTINHYKGEAHIYRASTTPRPTYLVYDEQYQLLMDSTEYWEVKCYCSHYKLYMRVHFHRYDYAQGATAAAGRTLKQYQPDPLPAAMTGGRIMNIRHY